MNKFFDLNLDKTLPIPIYYQLEKYLRNKIESEELKPGVQLPTEKDFQELLRVSRITVRKAMDNLQRDNLIEIKKGQGTFIKSKQFYEPVFGVRSYTEEALKQGFKPSTKILELKLVNPDSEINEKLNTKSKVYKITRLRLLNNKPTGIDNTYIVSHYVPNLSTDDFEEEGLKQSLYHILETKYNLVLYEAEEIISATITTKEETNLLGLSKKVPINLRKRVVYLPNKAPLLYMKSLYKTSYKTKLKGRSH